MLRSQKIGHGISFLKVWIHVFVIFSYGSNINSMQGQSTLIDSLVSVLNQMPKDSNYLNTLHKLIGEVRFQDGKKALELCKEGLDLCSVLDFPRGYMLMYYDQGVARYEMGQFESAISPIEEALRYARKLNNQSVVGACFNILGVLHQNLNQTDDALKYLFESLNLSKRLKDSAGILDAYINIGTQYFIKEDNKTAKSYYNRAEKLALSSHYYIGLGNLYLNLSAVTEDDSIKHKYLESALKYAVKYNQFNLLGYVYQNMGSDYISQNVFDSAEHYLRLALSYTIEVNNTHLTTKVQNSLGYVLMKLQSYDSAKYYLERGIVLARENNYLEELRNGYFFLSKWYEKSGNFPQALKYLSLENELRDTLFNEKMNEKLAEANARYRIAEKDKELLTQKTEIESQRNQKKVIFFGGILVLVVLFSLFLSYYSYSKRKKKEAELALELEQVEKENLKKMDDMKTQFFANISHELRTPLTLIIDPLRNALDQIKGSKYHRNISLAFDNSQKLLSLVNEILDLTKLESGGLPIYRKEHELKPLIYGIFSSFESLAGIKEIKLLFDYQISEEIVARVDAGKLEKIINNLLSNAIKFSPKGGEVTLRVKERSEEWLLTVEDRGMGIEKQDLDKIFDRYYQSPSNQPYLHGGTGIGLALSKQFALLLGGDLRVKSMRGKGSVFTLQLPKESWSVSLSQKPKSIQNQRVASEDNMDFYKPLFIGGERPQILIVEDNREMADYLCRILSDLYNCTVAQDGMEALKLVQTRHFDLITSDVMMPHMDGFQFRARVNEMKALTLIPFIFLTAKYMESDKLIGLRLGVDDFITKPFNSNELKARIYNLLSNKIARETWLAEYSDDKVGKSNADNHESQIVKNAERWVFKHLSDPSFKVGDLASHLALGERQLRRVIRKYTGLSPVNFILEIRLSNAFQLLEHRTFLTIAEVQYAVGIESASYFTKAFKERFGLTPTEVLSQSSPLHFFR